MRGRCITRRITYSTRIDGVVCECNKAEYQGIATLVANTNRSYERSVLFRAIGTQELGCEQPKPLNELLGRTELQTAGVHVARSARLFGVDYKCGGCIRVGHSLVSISGFMRVGADAISVTGDIFELVGAASPHSDIFVKAESNKRVRLSHAASCELWRVLEGVVS